MRIRLALGFAAATYVCVVATGQKPLRPAIPRTWDEAAMADLEIPLADPSGSPQHVSAAYYYKIPVRPIYKSYPVFVPSHEPAGYFESLHQKEPEQLLADMSSLKTQDDWIRAGEVVFDAPVEYGFVSVADARNPGWYERVRVPVTRDGMVPS